MQMKEKMKWNEMKLSGASPKEQFWCDLMNKELLFY